MKTTFPSLFLLIILSVSCQTKQVTADLELDPRIKEIIQSYQAAMLQQYGQQADSLDIHFSDHYFLPKCISIRESNSYERKIPFLITYENGVKIRVYSQLSNLFENKSQFFFDDNRSIYETSKEIYETR